MADDNRIDRPDESRLTRLHALRARGINPYPNDFKPSASIAEVADEPRRWKQQISDADPERWVGERDAYNSRDRAERLVEIAGRVMARRDFGKGLFLSIQDRSGRVQVLLGAQNLPTEPGAGEGQ